MDATVKSPSDLWDTIVVVGGKEFHESSHNLRLLSNYFDAAFRSGMKESQTKRFEFPDKDPEEWECIMSMCAPFSTTKINKDNLRMAYGWFNELGITSGLEECDQVLFHLAKWPTNSALRNLDFLEIWEMTLDMHLPKTREECIDRVCHELDTTKNCADLQGWRLICSCIRRHDDEELERLWDSLSKKIPTETLDHHGMDALVKSSLLPDIIELHLNSGYYPCE
jgi:BTB/POZ domain